MSFLRLSTAVVSVRLLFPSRPPVFPLLLLLASSAAWRTQLSSASPPCHVVMKRSAASTTPGTISYPSQPPTAIAPFLLQTGKGIYPWYPSVAWNTLMLSARRWVHVLSGRPCPGFSPPVIVRTSRVSGSLVVHFSVPTKGRRRMQMTVPTLSHCAFFRATGRVNALT